jgi:drug/metabolite transporter (DMT)-like permease
MGVLAAVGQGLGAIFAAAGLGKLGKEAWLGALAAGDAAPEQVSPLVGTLLRMLVGCAGMLVYAAALGRMRELWRSTNDRRAVLLTSCGALFGPFVGVWLSLAAFKHTKETAVAQTIMAFSPVIVIAIARVLHGERMTARGWIGSIAAIGGVAVLVFRDKIG